jgi:hypothetical protein
VVGLLRIASGAIATSACDSLYDKTMRRFGIEKRDILVKRVRDARKLQQEAKDEFRSARFARRRSAAGVGSGSPVHGVGGRAVRCFLSHWEADCSAFGAS